MALDDLLPYSDHQEYTRSLVAYKGGYYEATLTGNVTLDNTYPMVVGLDPDGAGRDVVLDGDSAAAGDALIHGLMRRIVNRADAAEDLTVKDATGATIGTVSQNEMADFYHDSDTGWTLIAITTIALS